MVKSVSFCFALSAKRVSKVSFLLNIFCVCERFNMIPVSLFK